jgi:ubiquinone/menaquinone biosynthesis C-methylase UbiE
MNLRPGQSVLDVGSGTGSSALLAARCVAVSGATPQACEPGSVVGVDFAEGMVARARQKAAEQGMANAFFEVCDLMAWTPAAQFDVVLGAFSIFHLPDPPAALEKLAGWTRRPGRWGFTFWGEGYLQEFKQSLREDVAQIVPGYCAPASRLEGYDTPEKIRAFLDAPGRRVQIRTDVIDWPLQSVEDWWTMAWNSGERRTIEAVPGAQREQLRQQHLERMRQRYPGALSIKFTVHTARVEM